MIISNNNFIQIFKEWAESKAGLINDFGYGPLSDWGNTRQLKYPCMWVTDRPGVVTIGNRNMTPTHNFSILFVDQINIQDNTQNENANDSDNRIHIMSDTKQLAYDFLNDSIIAFNAFKIIVEPTSECIPVEDETTDKVNGWMLDVSFRTPYLNCTIPSISPMPTCQPAYISNSDDSFTLDALSGMQTELDDITVTVGGGAVLNFPSNKNLNLGDYYYAVNPTGTRIPQTIPIQNGNTQVPWLSSVNVTTGLGTIQKVSGPRGYNSQGIFIISTLGDFEVEWRFNNYIDIMYAGLNYVDAAPTEMDIDFAFQTDNGFNIRYVENGTVKGFAPFFANANTLFAIRRTGFQIHYIVDGNIVYTSNVIASSNALSRGYMLFDCALIEIGNGLKDVKLTYL